MNGANDVPMIDCYIVDLDPTDSSSHFMITWFSLTNGVPYLQWVPDNRPGRVYTILGKESLTALDWLPTNQVPAAIFFQVGVELQ